MKPEHKQQILEVLPRFNDFTEWESGFMRSMAGLSDRDIPLSSKQADVLQKLHNKYGKPLSKPETIDSILDQAVEDGILDSHTSHLDDGVPYEDDIPF